ELLSALDADPARARREWGVRGAVALGVAAAVLTAAWVARRESPEQRLERECLARVDSRSAEIWGPGQQATIGARFALANPDVGAENWTRVQARFDRGVAD